MKNLEDFNDAVLVIGAAHMDIVGDYHSCNGDFVDKVGDITYAVGGTAYNIAVNLARRGLKVRIATAIKKHSLISDIVKERLISQGVDVSLIQERNFSSESGFLAHRMDGHLVSAVTSATVENSTFRSEDVEEAVKSCRFMVVDCNVSALELEFLVGKSECYSKNIFIAGVSQIKIKRIKKLSPNIRDSLPFMCVFANEVEAMALLNAGSLSEDALRELDESDRVRYCCNAGAKHLFITRGAGGHTVIHSTGKCESFTRPEYTGEIKTFTGCGDAFMSAVCYDYYKHRDFDVGRSKETIFDFVVEATKYSGATPDAMLAESELAVVPREKYIRYIESGRETINRLFGSRYIDIGNQRFFYSELLGIVGILIGVASPIIGFLV